ncbi:MAG: segregation/condensation protein A [Firmicutes bacterium]|nr:segregation/condensation protein A [Bacillota bacterium]MBR6025610.1 segregation/condensation protein A [Bacillota bacterium]
MYKVKLDIFEGPFDLLVYLIERARMSIFDIQVSEITTQYLAYIDAMKAQDVNVAQEFMVLAAELIELKSRMLIPSEEVSEDGTVAEDPRADLVARIREYKKCKEAAAFLESQSEVMSHLHFKPQEDLNAYRGEEDVLLKTDINQFAEAFMLFLTKKQRMEDVRKRYERIERQKMSVEIKISQIRELFTKKARVLFSEMIADDKTRFNKVVSFMSILELLKQRELRAEQKERYGDIALEKRNDAEEAEAETEATPDSEVINAEEI